MMRRKTPSWEAVELKTKRKVLLINPKTLFESDDYAIICWDVCYHKNIPYSKCVSIRWESEKNSISQTVIGYDTADKFLNEHLVEFMNDKASKETFKHVPYGEYAICIKNLL